MISVSPFPRLSGTELGYAEITSTATSTANFATPSDVAGLSVTVNTSGPIKVVFDCGQLQSDTATDGSLIFINEDGTDIASSQYLQHATVSEPIPVHREVRRNPSAGSHTYKIRMARVSAGTVSLTCSATQPAFIQVVAL